jgi:hypothetical protein
MSYYILPRTNNKIHIKLITDAIPAKVHLSYSLYNYYNEIFELISHTCSTDMIYTTFDDVLKITNQHNHVSPNATGLNFKYKHSTSLVYDLIEIINTLGVFSNAGPIKTLHISQNYTDTIECVSFTRRGYTQDQNFYSEHNNSTLYEKLKTTKFDFMFLETQTSKLNDYSMELARFLMVILNNQSEYGSCIVKIDSVFHKPIIDILYILTSLYEKTYVIKPSTSNVATFEKYIVCKNFSSKCNEHHQMYNDLCAITKSNFNIQSFIDVEIPSYFCNKLDDINIIFGQPQLESLDQIINLLKNKNREDKIECIRRTNVQKSIQWCEKFKISHAKSLDKPNIFMSLE